MMPKLPESVHLYHDAVAQKSELLFTERQMLAYARAVAEACAAICDTARVDQVMHPEYNEACDDCANAIREAAKEIGK